MARLAFPQGYLLMIKRYLDERRQRCFTYRGLRSWLFRQREYRDVEWHTVERSIRRLVELGFLDRIEKSRNQVIFCWNENAERAIKTLLESIYGNESFR